MTTTINNSELLTALASWIEQLKNSYHNNLPLTQPPIKFVSSALTGWLETKQTRQGMIEITCVHKLIEQDEYYNLEDKRRECAQFNSLMERIRLPAYIWEDRQKSEFQLRWQETLVTRVDLKHVQQFFEQSLYLANALQIRLSWGLKNQSQLRLH